MLTADELTKLLKELELDWIERTSSTSDTNKFSEAVCAFSNDFPNNRRPGYLLVGVNDNGSLSGLTVTDVLLRNLGGLRDDGNIQPLPAITVSKFKLPGGEVAVVEVMPSHIPPVRYRGRVCIRVGPRRAYASELEERVLFERRVAGQRTWDASPCAGATLGELDLSIFSSSYLPLAVPDEVIRANNRSPEHQLASLRFFDATAGVPTYAGVMVFGKDARAWIPGAYLQCLRIRGSELSGEIIAQRELSGDLITTLRNLEGLVDLWNEESLKDRSTFVQTTQRPYPREALREFLMNAVMHRNYAGSTAPIRFYWFDDRIEIQSPGGLYGEATRANFPNQNSYRNPVVAEALKTLGFVNRFGRGVIVAQEALSRNSNPPAEFNIQDNYFLVVVKRTK